MALNDVRFAALLCFPSLVLMHLLVIRALVCVAYCPLADCLLLGSFQAGTSITDVTLHLHVPS
jgi:hypothetical protein